jgi:HlyD family secretion protein
VFVLFQGKAVRRPVRVGPAVPQGVTIEDGLIGGEDLILNPPPELKDGARARARGEG